MRTVMTQSCCFGHHDKATIIAWSADHGDCESYDFIKNIGLEMLANELLLSIPRTRAHQSSGTGSQPGLFNASQLMHSTDFSDHGMH